MNRIDRPGTAEEAWDSWVELGHLPAADPAAWGSAVIVAAHPDDEVLGAGGTMALLAAAGARLRLVAVTDGEASHPGADSAAVGRARTMESAAALEVLGVRDVEVIRLRLPDAGLAACEDQLTARLREQCDGFGMCLAPWEADAHADHEAAGRAARRAARLAGLEVLTYPIWMWHWAKPGDLRVPWQRACRIPLGPDVAARKRSAIGAVPAAFQTRYESGDGPHPHVHGANLGIRASAYRAAGGFRPLRTAADHALLAAVTQAGCAVLQASDITVQTSGRRQARAPERFGHLLRTLAEQGGVSRPAMGSGSSPLPR